jgi:hypothetical protein
MKGLIMTDEEQCKMLEKFINDHVLATHIEVQVSNHHKSFKPRIEGEGANYEDANLLASILTGAESFVYWVRRQNGKITLGGAKNEIRQQKKAKKVLGRTGKGRK